MRNILFVLGLGFVAPAFALDCSGSLLDQQEKRLLGGSENLCQSYGGKVVLVVNTASHCGFTPQYDGLEKLYKRYKDRGLVVLGFPSGDFHQEEKSDESIAKFCSANYGVSFPMYTKTAVTGDQANPLYLALRKATGQSPQWNFNKFLIGRDGKAVGYYPSPIDPQGPELQKAIEAELAKAAPAP